MPWGASTYRGNRIYVHVLAWESDAIALPAISRRIVKASLLGGGAVDAVQKPEGIRIAVPKEQRQELDTVIVLELDGPAADAKPATMQSASPGHWSESSRIERLRTE